MQIDENTFRDINIAFANELSLICDKIKIDVWELIKFANLHPRVNILSPGPGVGGHCIAVDPWFMISGNENEAQLARKARDINDKKPDWVISKILESINKKVHKPSFGNAKNVSIAIYGVTFKKCW